MAPITRICRVAPAKLNLALHVTGRRADGYHDLDSVFVHCVDGDEMWVEPADDLTLTVSGPFAQGLSSDGDNLIMRAAMGVQAGFADAVRPSGVWRGAVITLVKNLPLASGIGGGSADAAMAIDMLVALWGLPKDLRRTSAIAQTLGADVPPCLFSWPKHVVGRGDDYARLDDPAYRDWPVLLVNPGAAVPTGQVFSGWDGTGSGPLPAAPLFADVMANGRNDLEPAARAIAPAIGAVIDALASQPGAIGPRMSGSGATCFALFGSAAERDHACAAISAAHPGWWTLATRLA